MEPMSEPTLIVSCLFGLGAMILVRRERSLENVDAVVPTDGNRVIPTPHFCDSRTDSTETVGSGITSSNRRIR